MPEDITKTLRHGSPEHDAVLSKLKARIDAGRDHMEDRKSAWREINQKMRMYMDITSKAKKGDGSIDQDMKEMPFGRSMVVPASYSIHHVILTQLMSIFGARDPLVKVIGRGPEDIEGAKLMESVLAYDMNQMQAYKILYALCQDAIKFGVGITYDSWHSEHGQKVVRNQPPDGMMGQLLIELLGPEALISREFGIIREHNLWAPVNPFDYCPDPRVPISDVQQGEFVGHRFYRGYMHLLERSKKYGGVYFNVDKLKKIANSKQRNQDNRDGTDDLGDFKSQKIDELDYGTFELDHIQIKIIPKEWKLSDDDTPQIWWFTVANGEVIIRAHECPYDHQEFTYAVAESDPDFHSAFNPGQIESMSGLQRFMDWMFNAHLQNLMRHLYDALVFSPAYIEEGDVLNPGAARHMRTTALADELILSGGFNIQNFMYQLQVHDVTSPHLNAMQQIFQLAQRMTAANDPQMGMPTQDVHTLGEIQTITASASQRIAVTARLIDVMALSKLGSRAISNRLQFTETEDYFNIVGEAEETKAIDRLLINRYNLQGNYDYVYQDASLPPDPVRQARTWAQILETMSRLIPLLVQNPQYAQQIGLTEIPDINQVARESFKAMGVSNIRDFYKQLPPPQPPQVMPDEQVEQMAQAGDLVPMEGGMPPQGMM
jgi:hypothetical protein